MRAGFLWLASFACFPLAGWPVLAHPGYRRLSLVCRICLAAAAGAVLLSFWMTVLALARMTWRPIFIVLLAAVTATALRLLPLGNESGGETPTKQPPAKLFEKLALAIGAVSVVWASLAAASGAATSSDLILFWGSKAQAFAAARTIDAGLLGDPSLAYMHASYPPLVTNVYAFATIVAGRFAWGAAILTFPLLLGALALALPGVLRQAAPRRAAWACAALIVSAFGFLGNHLDVAGNGEPFLWLFETLAVAILIGPLASARGGQLLAGLLLAGAAAAKVEGLVFAVATVVAFLVLAGHEKVRRPIAVLLLGLPMVLFLAVWFAFGVTRRLFLMYEGYGLTPAIHWDRLAPVLAGIGEELWFGGFALPYVLPLAALLLAPGKSRRAVLPVSAAIVLAVFFVLAYLHGEADLPSWIHWSAGRVFSPITAFLAVASLPRRDRSGRLPDR